MPRWLIVATLVACAAAWGTTALLTRGGTEPTPKGRYVLELDNAFGLTVGSDIKEGGVRAGKIQSIELDTRTHRALVTFQMTLPGFDSLRRDAFCQVHPQSLIGEYYVDCRPGTGRPLAAGGHIPVSQTGSAISFDLLNTITRRPYNERLRVILGELGAATATRGPAINAALRRALPALRESNRVLGILANERRTLAGLARDGDRALAGVARRRREVSRFVKEAGDTSEISARRRIALSEQFRRYPGFLKQVPPAMRALGTAADAQTGSLRELSVGADQLRTFFNRLGSFSSASVPALKALGRAAQTGRGAARDAEPALAELDRASQRTPEVSRNAAIVLEHLDNRDNAAEPDKRSPGGKGYTGLEALLQYVFNQAQASNLFDAGNYILKVNLLHSEACEPYADAARARAHPECSAAIGPTQPGVTTPDPLADAHPSKRSHTKRRSHARRHSAPRADAPGRPPEPAAPSPAPPNATTPVRPPSGPPSAPALPSLPQVPPPPDLPGAPPRDAETMLDYLLGP